MMLGQTIWNYRKLACCISQMTVLWEVQDGYHIVSQSSVFYVEHILLSQPFLAGPGFHPFYHLGCPSLDTFQLVNIQYNIHLKL